ncbi:hypothetical protein NUW58_g4515 [Xylaria curta]|uniref:Uncharacterized protein n=1 Tax=Xylaria curta TaxID=42375 RepID=A0ACC1P672_9PEZI|nr:hypothetical protein NUW58_g4515 [Xylaria curta]
MGSKRAVIKSPPHELTIANTNLNTGRIPGKLYMSGHVVSSCGLTIQIRIYLDATKAALTGYQDLDIVGESALIPLGASRALTLSLEHSWGVGVDVWTGPTIGRNRTQPSPAANPQSGISTNADNTPKASHVGEKTIPSTGHHRMNPEAAEFYPSSVTNREYKSQTWGSPNANREGYLPFGSQYLDIPYTNSGAEYSTLPTAIGGYDCTQLDPGAPVSLDQSTTGEIWLPYPQWCHYYYSYYAHQRESQGLDFPTLFGYQ